MFEIIDLPFIFMTGSAEGFTQAEKVINSASKSGRWVMLKNVHLAPQWLVQLEKKLHNLTPHPSFRLFLTMEINPKVCMQLCFQIGLIITLSTLGKIFSR